MSQNKTLHWFEIPDKKTIKIKSVLSQKIHQRALLQRTESGTEEINKGKASICIATRIRNCVFLEVNLIDKCTNVFLDLISKKKKKINKKRIQSQNQNNYQKYIHCIELTK